MIKNLMICKDTFFFKIVRITEKIHTESQKSQKSKFRQNSGLLQAIAFAMTYLGLIIGTSAR